MLGTVLETLITLRPVPALHSVREVTLDPGLVVHQTVGTDVVKGPAPASSTLPVVGAAGGVSIVTRGLVTAVQLWLMSTVHSQLTVLATRITDRPLPTVCISRQATAIKLQVEHQVFPIQVRAEEVGWLLTVPVPPAVMRVGLPGDLVTQDLAVNVLLGRAAGRLAVINLLRTGPAIAVHVSRVETEPGENVELEVVRADLAADTAGLAVVVMVAGLGVGQVH